MVVEKTTFPVSNAPENRSSDGERGLPARAVRHRAGPHQTVRWATRLEASAGELEARAPRVQLRFSGALENEHAGFSKPWKKQRSPFPRPGYYAKHGGRDWLLGMATSGRAAARSAGVVEYGSQAPLPAGTRATGVPATRACRCCSCGRGFPAPRAAPKQKRKITIAFMSDTGFGARTRKAWLTIM